MIEEKVSFEAIPKKNSELWRWGDIAQ